MGMPPVVARSDEHGSRLKSIPRHSTSTASRWIAGAYRLLPTASVTAEAVQWPNEKGNFLHAGKVNVPVPVVLSGEFGTTASDLRQHVDQHFEIGELYTFKQSMSLFVNWTLHDG